MVNFTESLVNSSSAVTAVWRFEFMTIKKVYILNAKNAVF